MMIKSTYLFLALLAAVPRASWGQDSDACVNEISDFDLVDSFKNEVVSVLGDTVDYGELYARYFNFKAVPKACVGTPIKSVKFVDPRGETYCDPFAPFAAYGDRRGNYNGKILPLGSYNITATPYTTRRCTGEPGTTLVKTFTVKAASSTACPGATAFFEYFNADTDKNLGPMKTGFQMCAPKYHMNIKAAVMNCKDGRRTVSTKFNLSGNNVKDYQSIDTGNKFMLFGGEVADVLGEKWIPGEYKISATPYPRFNGRGPAGGSLSLQFNLMDCPKPTVDFCNGKPKPAVAEDSGFAAYPVVISLNGYKEFDGYESVIVKATTATSTLAAPEIHFASLPEGVVATGDANGYMVTGASAASVEEALLSLEIRPGVGNGETISVTVTAKGSVSTYDPSLTLDDTLTTEDTCVIPVRPGVAKKFELVATDEIEGIEDRNVLFRSLFDVKVNEPQLQGSEAYMLEIKASTLPARTRIFVGRNLIKTTTHGFYRVAPKDIRLLRFRAPPQFSGVIDVETRASIVLDPSTASPVEVASPCHKTVIKVAPRSDGIQPTDVTVGVEDVGGPLQFGATLAKISRGGIRVRDRGQGAGNNPETETIVKIEVDVPRDTDETQYTLSGEFVSEDEETTGSGTGIVLFDQESRTYTITSSLLADVSLSNVSIQDRETAEKDIRNTLKTFAVAIGTPHSADNGGIEVSVTVADVNIGIVDTKVTKFNPVMIKAVADAPTLTVADPAPAVDEDHKVPLEIKVGRSRDEDRSEDLKVRIEVPSDSYGPIGSIIGETPEGVELSGEDGVYIVSCTASVSSQSPLERENLLNSFLSGNSIFFMPRGGFSGKLSGVDGLQVDAISSEVETGDEIAGAAYGGSDKDSSVEVVTAFIGLEVRGVANAASLTLKGNAVGLEDTRIPIPLSVTLLDTDGSETYMMHIADNLPEGAKLYGQEVLLTAENGHYLLTPEDVNDLSLLPPKDWSSDIQGDIILSTTTIVTEAGVDLTAKTSLDVSVDVTGVADKPNARVLEIQSDEDGLYDLGSAIGTIDGILVDIDTSEKLTLVVAGLPGGVVPIHATGSVNFLGSGRWQVDSDALLSLKLPPVANFSGEKPYPNLVIYAVSQEIDGSQAKSDDWTINFDIQPVADGFESWKMYSVAVEEDNEAGGAGVLFTNSSNHEMIDADGSEEVVSYTFDLSSLIEDAGLFVRLQQLSSEANPTLDTLAHSYIDGTFTYDSSKGSITVLPDHLDSVALRPELFLDSNQDFDILVEALVRDTATIDGVEVTADKIETGTLTVDLIGSADTPTAFASSAEGASGSLIPITIGGVTQDFDVELGRAQSEEIYYILTCENFAQDSTFYRFSDSDGKTLGMSTSTGSTTLLSSEIANLHLSTSPSFQGILKFKMTTVALENDGDMATEAALFEVEVTKSSGSGESDPADPAPPAEGEGGGDTSNTPIQPVLELRPNSGIEDTFLSLDLAAYPNENDETSPSISLAIGNVPTGSKVTGARLNPELNKWIADATTANAGGVSILPPLDFSGTFDLTVQVTAINSFCMTNSGPVEQLSVYIDPVVDGADWELSPDTGLEDTIFTFSVDTTERDIDGSEVIESLYVQFDNDATVVGGEVVQAGDSDAEILEQSMEGFYRVAFDQRMQIPVQPALNWHGKLQATVFVVTREPLDDEDGDHMMLQKALHPIEISAVADQPTVTVPSAPVTGLENTKISIPSLSAAVVDDVKDNGEEFLTVTITGVPDESIFSAGENLGDGSWIIPAAALSGLVLTPPEYFSGHMDLTLNAFSLETSNGDTASRSEPFKVVVEPVASGFLMVAKEVFFRDTQAGTTAPLDLNIRMFDTRGDLPNETPAETITLTFTELPVGVSVQSANGGGSVTPNGPGSYTFVGSEAQSNQLELVLSSAASPVEQAKVYLSAFTTDGTSVLAPAVEDEFFVSIQVFA